MLETFSLQDSVQTRIHKEIPAAALLDFRFLSVGEGIAETLLPLSPNTNHLGTLFGGSLYVQGALTCFAALLGLINSHGYQTNNIVIAKGEINYIAPGECDSTALAIISPSEKARVLKELRSHKARSWIEIETTLKNGTKEIAKVKGRYLVRSV